MARQLKNIVIKEVSSVDRGAGDGARVMLIKRDAPKEKPADNVIDMTGLLKGAVRKEGAIDFDEAQANMESREAANDMIQEVNEAICAFSCAVQSILCDEDVGDKNAAIQESFAQFKSYLAGLSPESMEKAMTPDEIKKQVEMQVAEAVKKAGETHAAELAKRDAEIAFLKMSPAHQEFAKAMSDEDKKKFAAKTAAERDKDVEDAKKALVTKIDPEIQKRLDKADENEKLLKGLIEKDEIATFAKRATDLGLPESHGEVLRKAYGGDAEAIKKHEEMLKGLAEQVKTGKVFSEFGSSISKVGATAYDELVAKAAEYRKTPEGQKLTVEQAFDKVYNDPANVELRKRYSDEEVAKRNRVAA